MVTGFGRVCAELAVQLTPGGQEALKRELKAREKELQDAQRRQRDNLQKQIRRSQARVSADDRKRRTRRLILIGSYMEHVTQTDPDRKGQPYEGTR